MKNQNFDSRFRGTAFQGMRMAPAERDMVFEEQDIITSRGAESSGGVEVKLATTASFLLQRLKLRPREGK